MTPYLQDPDVTLYHGDVLDVLREMPAHSIDCVVTSPPYWGLRDYGIESQLGLEPTPELYVERMVEVFREVRRVLASHGTVWCNLGDTYNSRSDGSHGGWNGSGIKPKDLVGIPWRVAFALQADGWYLRSDIIWLKPNPMPESVTDRPTKAHEYVFLLSKQPRYFFDQEAVREGSEDKQGRVIPNGHAATWLAEFSGEKPTGRIADDGGKFYGAPATGRNIRSVWEIVTQPYPEAHFATFPEELARRCIAAGCPEQVCRVCGKARERMVERVVGGRAETLNPSRAAIGHTATPRGHSSHQPGWRNLPPDETQTRGFTDCGHFDYRCGVTLDPFMGSGTVAFVARKLGRRSIGIDLSAEYLALAARRLQQQSLFATEPA